MSTPVHTLLAWIPRLTGAAVAVFLSLFALDAFDGRPVAEVLWPFAVHLVPAIACAAIVLAAWRHPWAGAVGFGALAVAYALSVPSRPNWIAVISGPLLLTAVLFAVSAGSFSIRRPHSDRTAP